MATLPKTGLVSYEEWLRMPDIDDALDEVVNGEIRLMPLPKSVHARIVRKVVRAFDRQLDEIQYEIFSEGFGLVIKREPFTCRAPDVAIFERATLVEIDGYFHSAPKLAIEVLSPSETRRQTAEKIADYESLGIPEVWIVSPQAATVEVLLLEEGRLRRSAILAEGILKPREVTGVQIDIAQIWPD